jgi:hypothetical protein
MCGSRCEPEFTPPFTPSRQLQLQQPLLGTFVFHDNPFSRI